MSTYSSFRYPAEIIVQAVYLYHRFVLRLREVEEVLAYRGIEVTYETIHQRCMKSGSDLAKKLRNNKLIAAVRGR